MIGNKVNYMIIIKILIIIFGGLGIFLFIFFESTNKNNNDLNFTVKRNLKTHIDKNGYRRFNDSNKLVSRWVMEKNIGRRLLPEEVVHHINGIKLYNNIYNLRLYKNQTEHEMVHLRHKQIYGTWHEKTFKYTQKITL
jgi:hypothetical protein